MDKFSWPAPPSQTAFPVASAGYPFILVAAFTTAILALLGFTTLTLIGLVVTFCICGFFRDACRKISIFMSVFNVHVNRVPYNGQVREIDYYPGKFFSANLDKASEQNEHNAVSIEMETGQPLCVVQIAGLIARRIICHIRPGDNVIRGQRFGLICFGSRLDVYLPAEIKLRTAVGDKVKAGTSILGQLEIE